MEVNITQVEEYLEELKAYLHIVTADDDQNLKTLMTTARNTLIRWCGSFDFSDDEGKQLVFDYVRYMRSGASEYFYQNFRTQIHSFAFSLMEVPNEVLKEE